MNKTPDSWRDMSEALAYMWFFGGLRRLEPASLKTALDNVSSMCGEVYIETVATWLRIAIEEPEPCPTCGGSGYRDTPVEISDEPCPDCGEEERGPISNAEYARRVCGLVEERDFLETKLAAAERERDDYKVGRRKYRQELTEVENRLDAANALLRRYALTGEEE